MNDLQAIIDFQIELSKFINIDLFRRGLYQIRINHHITPKIPHKIEVNFLQDSTSSSKKKESSISPNIVFPASIINGVAVSKTFNILYKNEEVILDDVIHFKDHLIVDSSNCLKQLLSTEFYLDVELWFTESSHVPSNQDQIRLMFRRQLKLHFNVCQGLHYYLPVTFDYFHLSTITLSVHACLVTLCLPYLNLNKSNELETSNHGLGYDHLFFGCSFNEIQNQINTNCTEILKLRQRRAQLLHWQLCSLLLTSIQNLSRKFNEYLRLLPPLVQCKYRKDRSLTHFQLTNLSKLAQQCHRSCLENGFKSDSNDFFQIQNINFAKEILKDDKEFKNNLIDKENESKTDNETVKLDNQSNDDKSNNISTVDKNDNKIDELSIYQPEDYIASIVSELAYICGCHITIWQSFIKLITHNEKINQHLSKIHHLHRCKRFSEAFFVKEKKLQQLISTESNNSLFYELSDKLRRSKYLQLLPVCQIECASLDGDHITMPIIFEEKFDFDNELIANNDKESKSNDSIQSKKEILTNKNLRRSSSDVSTNSSLTSSSLNSATNTSSGTDSSGNILNDNKSNKSSIKLKDKIVLNLNKLNLNGNLITRRKSSISYLSKQEQQKIVLNGNLSTSSSTNNSNNSSLNSQITSKSLNVEQQNETVVDSPKIIIDSISNDESPKSILEQLNCLSHLNSFKHYNNLKGEPEEFISDNNSSSIYSLVETISLNNIKFVNDQNTNDTNSKQKKKKSLASSESLPDLNDLSVKHLQKTIKRMTKKNSKKLKSSKKDKKESNNSKRIKSAVLNENKSHALIDTISLNFSTNIDSLNKTNLDLEEKDEFSDLDGFIDENEDKNGDKKDDKKDDNVNKKKTKDVQKCTILEMFTRNTCLVCGIENCNCIQDFELTMGSKNLSMITNELVQFVKAKEQFRKEMNLKTNGWSIYSDFSTPSASRIPYFQLCDNDLMRTFNSDGVHLVVCVHGLDGNSCDLRLIKTYLELLLPMTNFDFLMSESNQGKTYDSFEIMTDRLCDEIIKYIQLNCLEPTKISFIGHSLGNIIIRSVLRKPELAFLLPKLHCFLSLSGPHLGTIYMTNNLVNIGLWFMQKWKKSNSILQLTLKDNIDPYKTFIYNLSKDSKIHLFKYVLLCGSTQDHYVPIHSAHIRDCNQSKSDYSVTGQVYRDMINNILRPFLTKKSTTSPNLIPENKDKIADLDKQIDMKRCSKLIRYDVLHADGGGTNSLIGRQAHIAVLDCELFIEKMLIHIKHYLE